MQPIEEYFVTGRDSMARRRPGESAHAKADSLKTWRSPLAHLMGVNTEEGAWRAGAVGEQIVGHRLDALREIGWFAFHDLPIGSRGANVDHLVVGPGGLFTINTKNLSGKVWLGSRVLMVNGRKTDYLPKAAAEAKRVGARLGVPAKPVIALICRDLRVKQHPDDVIVIQASRLTRWLVERKPVLGREDVARIARLIDAPATWDRSNLPS